MPRKKSKAVFESNGPVPQDSYVLLDGILLEEISRTMSESLDKAFYKPKEKMREPRQRSAGLEQEARRPRLAKEADANLYNKTRPCMVGTAAD